VFLSSHTEPEIVQKTEAIASYGYVVKNSGEQVLLASIRMAFRLADANAALMQEKATEAVRTNVLLELHENHSHAPEKLYDYILGASLALTGSKHSFFGLLDDEESEMVIHAWSKEAAADCAVRGEPIHFPVSRAGIWGDCVRRREPVIYNDYNADIPSKRGVPAGHVPIRRFLGFPVFEGEKIVAVGGVANKNDPYDQTDVESLQLLYDQVWVLVTRNLAEARLRESEQRLEVATALNSDYAYCNKLMDDGSLAPVWSVGSFDAITGYTPEELHELGGWVHLTHADDIPGATEYVRTILSGEPATCTVRIVTKGGDIRWIEDSGRPWIDKDTGAVIGHFGSARDITRQKNVELELRRQDALYRNLMENSIDAVYLISEHGRILNVNHVACEMTGYTRDELLSLTIDDVDPNYPSEVFRDFWNSKDEGATVLFETTHRRKDGSVFPVEVNGISFSQDDERFLFGVARDLTERRRHEEDLRRIEWMLRPKELPHRDAPTPEYGDLSQLNKDGLILSTVGSEQLLDLASEYLDLLETSAAVYEKNGDYALGLFTSGWCRLMDTSSRKLSDTEDNSVALASGKWLCHEACWADASVRAMETDGPIDIACRGGIRLYAVPVRANGEVIGAINFGYGDPPADSGSLENLAQAYDVSTDELRRAAAEYQSRPPFIIDLAKRRLQKSAYYLGRLVERAVARQDMMEALEEKDFLMAELNHRVKNNLLMISSLIDLKKSSATGSADLADIKHQIDAIRIVHGRLHQSQTVSNVALDEYLNDLLANLIPSAAGAPITVEKKLEDIVVPTRQAVPVALIVNELATNAVKYGVPENARPVFSVDLARDPHTRDCILMIANNGPPIPAKISLENPSTLGLRLVSGLVEQLDGRIELKRSPTPAFTIRFPLEEVAGLGHSRENAEAT
jgi:PAS domain S-box-containing protein